MIDTWKIADALYRRGFSWLGGGFHSQVYGKAGSDRVIKLCGRSDPWAAYVLWAHHNGYGGTYAPRLHSLHIFENRGETGYLAVMERLVCTVANLPRPHPTRDFFYELQDLCYHGGTNATLPLGYVAFANAFYVWCETHGYTRDLHGNNWMTRADGSLVLIDPVCGDATDTSPTRLRSRDLQRTLEAA